MTYKQSKKNNQQIYNQRTFIMVHLIKLIGLICIFFLVLTILRFIQTPPKNCLDLSQKYSDYVVNMKDSIMNQLELYDTKENKFEELNSILDQIKSHSNNCYNNSMLLSTSKLVIEQIINTTVKSINEELAMLSETNIQYFNIKKMIIKLHNLKNIKATNQRNIIQNSINNICDKAGIILKSISLDIVDEQINEILLKKAKICVEVLQSLEFLIYYESGPKKIWKNANELFQKIIGNKLNETYIEIKNLLDDYKLEKAQQMLSKLKVYSNSNVNKYLGDKIKDSFRILQNQYTEFHTNVLKKVQLYCQDLNIKQLLKLMRKCEIQKYIEQESVVMTLCQIVEKELKQIKIGLFILKTSSNVKFKMIQDLGKKVYRVKKFSEVKAYFEGKIDYVNQLRQIAYNIKEYYIDKGQSLKQKIKKEKISNIKIQLQQFANISILLFVQVQNNMLNVQKQFQQKREQLIQEGKHAFIQRQLDIYEKMRLIDSQYLLKNAEQVYHHLKVKVFTTCNKILEEIRKATDMQAIQIQEQKLSQLKQIISLSNNIDQFTEFIQHIEKTEKQISGLVVINKLKFEFQKKAKLIQQLFRNSNFRQLFQELKNIERLEKVNQHIEIDTYGSPKQFIRKTKNEIYSKAKQLQRKLVTKFSDNIFDSSDEVFKFIGIQIQTNCKSVDMKAFLNALSNYIKGVFPSVNKNSPLDLQFKRLTSLKSGQEFLKNIKQKLAELSPLCSLSENQNLKYILNLQLYSDMHKRLSQILESLPKTIEQLWSKNKYKQIYTILSEIKKSDIKSHMIQMEDLFLNVRYLLQKKGDEISQKLKENKFKEAQQGLGLIKAAEQELSKILELPLSELHYQSIINQLNIKIENQIVSTSLDKIRQKPRGYKNDIALKLIQLSKWGDRIPEIVDQVDKNVKIILKQARKQNLIFEISGELSNYKDKSNENDQIRQYSGQILYKYSSQLQVPRILPPIRMGVKQAIQQFQGEQIDKYQLYKVYQIYEAEFEYKKTKNIAQGSIHSIQSNLKEIKQSINKLVAQIQAKTHQTRFVIPKVLANIFIYWSLSKSGQSFYLARQKTAVNQNSPNKFLLQPHPIQVLSILRFIGCDDKKAIYSFFKQMKGVNPQNIENHIMQIKTGEGKSIILGAMSILFALMGHKVDCVSYSEYLSKRDYEDFQSMFEQLGVSDRIEYGTFRSLAQKLINQGYDIRQLALSYFQTDQNISNKNQQNYISRILLVDQVDTFFSKDFYGVTYNPITILRKPEISSIINIIWRERSNDFQRITAIYKQSQYYKKLLTEYSDCIQYFDKHFLLMIYSAKNFSQPQYVVQKGQIGYKQNDGLSFSISYGYRTMFAYLYQSLPERGKVEKQFAQSKLGITIGCGHFSYAEMIRKYDKIFGVSGTVESLSEFEQKTLASYNIRKKTFAPSVYGNSKRFDDNTLIQNNKDSHCQLISKKTMSYNMQGTPVLVFFENQVELEYCFQSPQLKPYQDKINIVTERSTESERKNFIKKATYKGAITFFTAPFGRGTDFVIFDPVVQLNGTVVIQAFLSEEKSEQIQMTGRSARQGQQGKYQLILNRQKIKEKYGLNEKQINFSNQRYASASIVFDEIRKKHIEDLNKKRQKNVKEAKNDHQKSMAMKFKMINKAIKRNDPFFFDY